MKLKVTYFMPAVSVSETIEVGTTKNGELTTKQTAKVDKLIITVLQQKLVEKVKKTNQK